MRFDVRAHFTLQSPYSGWLKRLSYFVFFSLLFPRSLRTIVEKKLFCIFLYLEEMLEVFVNPSNSFVSIQVSNRNGVTVTCYCGIFNRGVKRKSLNRNSAKTHYTGLASREVATDAYILHFTALSVIFLDRIVRARVTPFLFLV